MNTTHRSREQQGQCP